VANQYLHRDQMRVLVVGNASEFSKQLAGLGQVTTLDITIPEPPSAQGAAAPGK
jgi:zinc protease